jgi:hypothetical protein
VTSLWLLVSNSLLDKLILKSPTKRAYESSNGETRNTLKLGLGKPKKKDQPEATTAESVASNRLRELCGNDVDLYATMSHLMFLDPKKIMTPIDKTLKEAQDYEAQGNKLRAEVGYRIAGGISLSKGDVDGVNRYFSKAASLAGDSHPEYQTILKRSSEAVAIAAKYYAEFDSTIPHT